MDVKAPLRCAGIAAARENHVGKLEQLESPEDSSST